MSGDFWIKFLECGSNRAAMQVRCDASRAVGQCLSLNLMDLDGSSLVASRHAIYCVGMAIGGDHTTTYSADVWDGALAHEALGVATAANEAKAVQKTKDWAKSIVSVPEKAWLRVNINGTIRTFRFGEF